MVREHVFFNTKLKMLSPGPGAKQMSNKHWLNEWLLSVVDAVGTQTRSCFLFGVPTPNSPCFAPNSSYLKSFSKDYPWATGAAISQILQEQEVSGIYCLLLGNQYHWLRCRSLGIRYLCFKVTRTCQCNLHSRAPCDISLSQDFTWNCNLLGSLFFLVLLPVFPCSFSWEHFLSKSLVHSSFP